MNCEFGTENDIDSWMETVTAVRCEFPGLEDDNELKKHRETVLDFMAKSCALCIKSDSKTAGVILFSREENTICFLAVLPSFRRHGIAKKLLTDAVNYLDKTKPIKVSTFCENDSRGKVPRALYENFGFTPGEIREDFGCPDQEFVLYP